MVDITGGDESTCLVNFLNIVLPGTWCSKASSTCSCTLHDDYVLYVSVMTFYLDFVLHYLCLW